MQNNIYKIINTLDKNKTVLVTGSFGKSNCIYLIKDILERCHFRISVIDIDNNVIDESKFPIDFYLLNIPVDQLYTLKTAPHYLIVTTVCPYPGSKSSFFDYFSKIKRIISMQAEEDFLIWNTEYDFLFPLTDKILPEILKFNCHFRSDNGAYRNKELLIYQDHVICKDSDRKLPGEPNLKSYLAAITLTGRIAAPDIIRKAVQSYNGTEYHYNLIKEDHKIRYFNNAFSFLPSHMIASFQPYKEKIILVTGGENANGLYRAAGMEIIAFAKILILFGSAAEPIKEAVINSVHYDPNEIRIWICDGIEQAAKTAMNCAENKDVVLYSPCSPVSKGNYRKFGDVFTKCITKGCNDQWE